MRRIVLTFDLDFGEIAARCVGPWTSVIVFRLADATSDHVSERLEATLARTGASLDAGAVVVIEEGRCRVRSLPIERWDCRPHAGGTPPRPWKDGMEEGAGDGDQVRVLGPGPRLSSHE